MRAPDTLTAKWHQKTYHQISWDYPFKSYTSLNRRAMPQGHILKAEQFILVTVEQLYKTWYVSQFFYISSHHWHINKHNNFSKLYNLRIRQLKIHPKFTIGKQVQYRYVPGKNITRLFCKKILEFCSYKSARIIGARMLGFNFNF
jgi:hypothetical protein